MKTENDLLNIRKNLYEQMDIEVSPLRKKDFKRMIVINTNKLHDVRLVMKKEMTEKSKLNLSWLF